MINIYKTISKYMEREMLSSRTWINWGRTSWPWNTLEKLTSWIWESIFFQLSWSHQWGCVNPLCCSESSAHPELTTVQDRPKSDRPKHFPKGIKMFVNVVSQSPCINLHQKDLTAARPFKPVILQMYALEEQYMTKMVCSHIAQGLSSPWDKSGRICLCLAQKLKS